MFRAMRDKSPGDWSGRRKLQLKGAHLSLEVVDQMDAELLRQWEALREADKDLWSINCLLYVGSEAVARFGVSRGRAGEAQESSGESENESDSDIEATGNFEEVVPPLESKQKRTLTTAPKRLMNLKAKRQQLRRVIGWLEAELQLGQVKGGRRGDSKKRRARLRQLKARWP